MDRLATLAWNENKVTPALRLGRKLTHTKQNQTNRCMTDKGYTDTLSLPLPPKKNTWSLPEICEYFGYPKNGKGVIKNDELPVYKTALEVSSKGGNTSNMIQHQRDHPTIYAQVT